ncbi:pimeloyl-ACP methyl ester carboxylesterase [Shinella sp. BE166]|uniref:alpha/beta fold hydrolase n=1 Tax=Shinella sp. BE166 TaxID=3373918 RepID=UPI003EC003D5
MSDLEHITNDVAIRYRIHGDGPEPLLCIHGVGASGESWDDVAARLPDRFTIVTFDLRGHGRSTKVKGRYEIDDFVDDALSLADHVGFFDFNLAGFSLGGLIAQRMALTHASRVRRLFLFSTVANRTEEERERVLARLHALRTTERGSHYDASMSRWFSDAFRAANPELMAQLRAQNAKNDPESYAAAYRVLAETDFGGLLDQIRCPTLIATGEHDIGSNPRMARTMHEAIVGSELAILEGLRHSILVEAPDVVASLIGTFVSGKTVRRRTSDALREERAR